MLIEAIGARPSADLKAVFAGLSTVASGRPVSDPETLRTSDSRIFVGGDLAAAGKTVAACVLDGKKVADAIAQAFPLRTPRAPPRTPQRQP